MIRKIALVGALVLSILSISSAQCTPDTTITEPGYYPPQLPRAQVEVSYDLTLNVLVIPDTSILFSGSPAIVLVDSAKLIDVVGLPGDFVYTCSNPNCNFTPKAAGCASIKGNPTMQDTGSHKLGLVITMYGKVFGSISIKQTDTLWRFVLDIGEENVSVSNLNQNGIKFYPNPQSGKTVYYEGPMLSDIHIYNAVGAEIFVDVYENKMVFQDYARGIYYIHATYADGKIVREKLVLNP